MECPRESDSTKMETGERSVFEMGLLDTFSRQFDDEPGGGFLEWSNRDRDRYDRDTNGAETFGDGSNDWIAGTDETLRGEGKQDISGVFDAAALNFDEGIGGWSTVFDSEPGNTAGPGQSSSFFESPQEGQPDNPGTTGSPMLDRLFQIALVGGALWLFVNVVAPLLEFGAAVAD